MQTAPKNKMQTDAHNKSEEEREFHFSGSGEYQPMTIKARTQEEAIERWEKERIKVESSQIIN